MKNTLYKIYNAYTTSEHLAIFVNPINIFKSHSLLSVIEEIEKSCRYKPYGLFLDNRSGKFMIYIKSNGDQFIVKICANTLNVLFLDPIPIADIYKLTEYLFEYYEEKL